MRTPPPEARPWAEFVRNRERSLERQAMQGLTREMQGGEIAKRLMQGEVEAMADFFNLINTPPPTQALPEIREEVRRRNAFDNCGLYLERPTDTVLPSVLYDFELLLAGAEAITLGRSSAALNPDKITIESGMNECVLKGETAIAFMRYMRYCGLLEALQERRPCPVCAYPRWETGEAVGVRDQIGFLLDAPRCDTCGDLGWILREQATEAVQ